MEICPADFDAAFPGGVFIGKPVLARVPAFLCPLPPQGERAFLFGDSQVANLIRIVRTRRAFEAMGYQPSQGYKLAAEGLIPKPLVLAGGGASGIPEPEINAVNKARIAGKSVQENRRLVAELHAARKTEA